jgi:2-polyprenyl-6-methoxyphenol hydroxylase-like FAD-dependent oxidoreductase
MNVLIVGAGIAGPTLAYWLRRQPTLIERAPELRRGGYLIDFWGAGFDVAERMGIVSELRRRGYRLREVRTVTASPRSLRRCSSMRLGSATSASCDPTWRR